MRHEPDPSAVAAAPDPTPTLRVAVASSEGQRIDLHFGAADAFHVYDVTTAGHVLVAIRAISDHQTSDEEDRRDVVCRMLADCPVMLVAKIGPAPQEKLAAHGVVASDMLKGAAIATALQTVYAEKAAAGASVDEAVDSSRFRLMHAMFRVADLDRSIAFYTEQLGMRVVERREHKKNQFSQAYLGFGDDPGRMQLELVFNWAREEPYTRGDSFGHIAIEVTAITALCNRLAAAGVPMPRPPRAQRHGENIVAFVEDPDGYRIELVQAPD
jgi:lactoylglutathione lyase